MAGGVFQVRNKIQPGVYINRKSIISQQVNQSDSGTVVYCMDNDWGVRGKLIDISNLSELQNKLGYPASDKKMRPIVEMFRGSTRTQGANTVRIYIPTTTSTTNTKASGTASDGTDNVLTIEAACYGTRGNKITVNIIPDLNTPTTEVSPTDWAVWVVSVYMDGVPVSTRRYGEWSSVSSFTKAKLSDLVDNDFVKFVYDAADKNKWPVQSVITLAGGTQGTLIPASYAECLALLEKVFFNVLCYDGADSTVKAAVTTFIQRQCEDRGYYCQAVMADYQTANYEGIVSIKNGMYLSDNYHLDKQKATWWYAGCLAGARYNESLTHAQHPLAVSVDADYSSSEIDDLINSGNVVFIDEFNNIMVCEDINTFTAYSSNKGRIYSSNRTLRVINTISNYCYYQYDINYVGLIDNNEFGRNILKTDITEYLLNMEANNGIQNFAPEDVTVSANPDDKKAVDMAILVETVDSIEKIYIEISAS